MPDGDGYVIGRSRGLPGRPRDRRPGRPVVARRPRRGAVCRAAQAAAGSRSIVARHRGARTGRFAARRGDDAGPTALRGTTVGPLAVRTGRVGRSRSSGGCGICWLQVPARLRRSSTASSSTFAVAGDAAGRRNCRRAPHRRGPRAGRSPVRGAQPPVHRPTPLRRSSTRPTSPGRGCRGGSGPCRSPPEHLRRCHSRRPSIVERMPPVTAEPLMVVIRGLVLLKVTGLVFRSRCSCAPTSTRCSRWPPGAATHIKAPSRGAAYPPRDRRRPRAAGCHEHPRGALGPAGLRPLSLGALGHLYLEPGFRPSPGSWSCRCMPSSTTGC